MGQGLRYCKSGDRASDAEHYPASDNLGVSLIDNPYD